MIQCMYTIKHDFKRGDLIMVNDKAKFVTRVHDAHTFEYRPVRFYDFALVAWWKLSDWFGRRFKCDR